MKYIPYGRQCIEEDDIKAVVDVLKSDWLTTGPKVKEFEDALCKYIGCKYAVAVNSGTSALDIAVQALNIEKGGEVITTPFTFAATSNAALYNGLKPVFCDIKSDTRNIDLAEIKKKITKKTRAIIYVDYAGHPCDIDEIRQIAKEHDLYLIEDACHALGAEYKGKKVGNFADMTIFSFHPVKHITTGEGGAIATNDRKLYQKLKLLRSHGIDKEAKERFGKNAGYAYDMKILGRNYRITDFQCALGISQLKKIDNFIEKRSELVRLYNRLLSDVDFVEIPETKPYAKHVWHLYTILLKDGIDRDKFFRYMKESNIGTNVHYIPIYKFSYYRENFTFNSEEYPTTEDVYRRIITLPLYPEMTEGDVKYVVNRVMEWKKRL
jgi:UDP-4-amino-4,6-dideoxy-N-acetyl-beta-L-altrosamine transaminase